MDYITNKNKKKLVLKSKTRIFSNVDLCFRV